MDDYDNIYAQEDEYYQYQCDHDYHDYHADSSSNNDYEDYRYSNSKRSKVSNNSFQTNHKKTNTEEPIAHKKNNSEESVAKLFGFFASFIENRLTIKNLEKLSDYQSQVKDTENKEIIIEAVNLAIKIQKNAPSVFTKGSDDSDLIYNGNTYYIHIDKFYSQNTCVEIQVSISRNDYSINDGKLLKADLTNDLKILKVYYNDISEGYIINMQRLLESYKNNKNQVK